MKPGSLTVFRLLLAERRFSNAWYVILLCLLVLPPILSIGVAPVSDAPGAVASTRAQITYIEVMVILFLYYGISVLHASHRQRQRGLRLVWRSLGFSDWRVFWQIALIFLLETGVVSLVGLALCFDWGNSAPGWMETCLQAWLAIWLAAAIFIPVAMGLAQRAEPGLAAILIFIFNLGGMYAVPWLDMFRNNTQTPALWQIISEKVWAVLPQLSLADQSERITFSWDPMNRLGFAALLGYLLAWVALSFYIGYKLFRKDPVMAANKAAE